MNRDAIAYAVNVENQGSNLVDAHALGVGELTVGSVFNFPATGSLDIDGDLYEYTAVDDEANTITLSGVTTAAYDDDARVELSPAAPVWFATVVVGSDQPGFNAMVPIHLVPMLADDEGGSVFPDGIPVILESINAGEYGWQVVAAPGRQPQHNASTAAIVTANERGEAARMDGDGYKTFTNDPLLLLRIPTATTANVAVGATEGHVFHSAWDGSSGTVTATGYDADSGAALGVSVSVGPNSPWSGDFFLTAAAGWVYMASPGGLDFRKFDAETGVEDTSGDWPVSGSGILAADATYAYLGASSIVQRYNITTGVEDTSGPWPLSLGAATITDIASDGTYIYIGTTAGAVLKYNIATGIEDTSEEWPLALGGSNASTLAAGGGHVYVEDKRFDATTGAEDSTWALPIVPEAIAYDDGAVYAVVGAAVEKYNTAVAFNTSSIESATGEVTTRRADLGFTSTTALEAAGPATFADSVVVEGPASVPNFGHSDEATLTAAAIPTSTTNVSMPTLDLTFEVGSTADVVWLQLDATVTIGVGNTTNIVEMLLDGVADPAQLITRAPAAPQILAGHKTWRLTGLSAGSHTVTFRTRNTAAATSATVNATHTQSSYWTSK